MKEVPINGAVNINKQYTLPDTKGGPGQILRIPPVGNTMEWLTPTVAGSDVTQLISGRVIWDKNLQFVVTNCDYYILGVMYRSTRIEVGLVPSDTENPRLDVIYVDTTGHVGILTGISSADPAKPIVDPLTQLELTSILINANATTPTNIANTNIYLEGDEWTLVDLSEGRMTVNDKSTVNPLTGTYCLSVTPVTNPIFLDHSFKYTSTAVVMTQGSLILNIKLPILSNPSYLAITLHNGSITHTFTLTYNTFATYGISLTSILWQELIIPLSAFSGSITEIDAITFSFYMGFVSTGSVYFDNIRLQTGIIVNVPIENKPIIQDIAFDYPDIIHGTSQTYTLDLDASFPYKVLSCVLKGDQTLTGVAIKINNVAITGLSAINVTTVKARMIASGNNIVAPYNEVTLVTTGVSNFATRLTGKIVIQLI